MNLRNPRTAIYRRILVIVLLAGAVTVPGGYILWSRGRAVTRHGKQEIDTRVAEFSTVSGLVLEEPGEAVEEHEFSQVEYDGALAPAMLSNSAAKRKLASEEPAMPTRDRETDREKVREQPGTSPQPAAGPAAAGPVSRSQAHAREESARTALTEAIAYEYNNFSASKEDLAARYAEVVSRFPGTAAAMQAAGMVEAIQKRYR